MIRSSPPHKKIKFPAGEIGIQLEQGFFNNLDCNHYSADIEFEYERNDEIFELVLVADALKRAGFFINNLKIPYLPYSRQDRVNLPGQALSIAVFADIVNSIGAKSVMVFDPHSDVSRALIKNINVIEQHHVFMNVAKLHQFGTKPYLIAPDAGSHKKALKIFDRWDMFAALIECTKIRSENGQILGVRIPGCDMRKRDCLIIDDICDGGATFIEIAKELKDRGAGEITLMVTHGFFTKGLEVFDGLIDHIYTRKGKVK